MKIFSFRGFNDIIFIVAKTTTTTTKQTAKIQELQIAQVLCQVENAKELN